MPLRAAYVDPLMSTESSSTYSPQSTPTAHGRRGMKVMKDE